MTHGEFIELEHQLDIALELLTLQQMHYTDKDKKYIARRKKNRINTYIKFYKSLEFGNITNSDIVKLEKIKKFICKDIMVYNYFNDKLKDNDERNLLKQGIIDFKRDILIMKESLKSSNVSIFKKIYLRHRIYHCIRVYNNLNINKLEINDVLIYVNLISFAKDFCNELLVKEVIA